MKDIYILGIESSCDETSMAIVRNGNKVESFTVLHKWIHMHHMEEWFQK